MWFLFEIFFAVLCGIEVAVRLRSRCDRLNRRRFDSSSLPPRFASQARFDARKNVRARHASRASCDPVPTLPLSPWYDLDHLLQTRSCGGDAERSTPTLDSW